MCVSIRVCVSAGYTIFSGDCFCWGQDRLGRLVNTSISPFAGGWFTSSCDLFQTLIFVVVVVVVVVEVFFSLIVHVWFQLQVTGDDGVYVQLSCLWCSMAYVFITEMGIWRCCRWVGNFDASWKLIWALVEQSHCCHSTGPLVFYTDACFLCQSCYACHGLVGHKCQCVGNLE